ncbi:MAG: DUF262 domain-containing protein [Coriobacteriia bacterium]|nr:DUF262 domain-containing protein [Coriobacteriia bacterium]
MSFSREPHWWSWKDIVQNAGRLGIPNFQRGAVWDMNNRTALLESLYEQSPCGSFVLWAPAEEADQQRHGVPLKGTFEPTISPMWLVDGQQRTRTMLDTFQQLLSVPKGADGWSLVRQEELDYLRDLADPVLLGEIENEEDEVAQDQEATEGDDDGRYVWGAVLPAIRAFDRTGSVSFGRYSEVRNVRQGGMFRRIWARSSERIDSKGGQKSVPPGPVGVVPLASLLAPNGVFHDEVLRTEAEQALRTLGSQEPDLEMLDELVPWGVQFITGHVYKGPDIEGTSPEPMRWASLLDHLSGDTAMMTQALTGLFSSEWRREFERFADMFVGDRFAVGWLPEIDTSAAIDAYVRINRSGIRVRSEERALALLSRAHPGLLDDLAAYIRLRDGDGPVSDGRSMLTHESDRQLGFPVWMATVTRYCALALLGRVAIGWLGTSAIDKSTFDYRLDRVGPDETAAGVRTWARRDYATPDELVRECSSRATRALVFIDSILSKELSLDHRMARPSVRAMTPLIDLLYRLPESAFEQLRRDDALRVAIARVLHWTLLAPYIDQPDLQQLIVESHGVAEEARAGDLSLPVWESDGSEWRTELRRALGRYQSTLLEVWHRKHVVFSERWDRAQVDVADVPVPVALTRLAIDAFAADAREARTLQHHAVGWLYAIERRGGTREFLWEAQIVGYEASRGKAGVPRLPGPPHGEAFLGRADGGYADVLYPEKQHIVPFAVAQPFVGKRGTRATSSQSNAIGNLTWLSRRQNGLDALSDRWTVMDIERDGENLTARGMLARSSAGDGSPTALALYEELRDLVLDERVMEEQERAQSLFESFCDARARWLVERMREWLEEPLPAGAEEWLGR